MPLGHKSKLHYELSGQGLPVLFIQGVGVPGSGWRRQTEALSQSLQSLVFDNRGVGRSPRAAQPLTIESMAADALALMDEIGWTSAHLVGHSMGGAIAQQAALLAPGRVRSLSLLCTFPSGRDAIKPTPWVVWMTLRTWLGPRAMRRRAFLEMLIPPEELRTRDVAKLAAEWSELFGRDLACQPPAAFAQVRALAGSNLSSRLAELASIPALVLSAEHDRIAPPACGRKLADRIPGAVFEEIQNASHGVIIDRPEWINPRLNAFIFKAESARLARKSGSSRKPTGAAAQ